MDLIERYLAAIGRQLPSNQAADIERELRDVLLSRIEEQEDRLGRPLTRPEVEALLVDFGHPLTVAGRYRRTQQLIGPEVFPFWWAAVKVMLSIVAAVYLVLITIGVLTHKTPAEFNRTVPSIWYVAVYLFGLITLVCMAIERFGKTRILQRWKPANLPPAVKQRSRFEIAAEMAVDVVFILWWSGLIHFRNWLPPYPGFLTIDLAPVWAAWHWPILAYYVVEIAANLIALARPGWITANAAILAGRYLDADHTRRPLAGGQLADPAAPRHDDAAGQYGLGHEGGYRPDNLRHGDPDRSGGMASAPVAADAAKRRLETTDAASA